MNSTYFNYWRSQKDGQWYFNYRGGNHERILQSEGYTSEHNCKYAIAAVQEISPYDSAYDRRQAINNQWYFRVVAGNNRVLAWSETYSSNAIMEHSINVVKLNAKFAPVLYKLEQHA